MILNKMAAEWQTRLMVELFAFLGEGTTVPNHRAWIGPPDARFYLRHATVLFDGNAYQGVVLANHECEDAEKFKWFMHWLEKVCDDSRDIQAIESESVMESWLAGHLVMSGWRVKQNICPNNVTLVRRKDKA